MEEQQSIKTTGTRKDTVKFPVSLFVSDLLAGIALLLIGVEIVLLMVNSQELQIYEKIWLSLFDGGIFIVSGTLLLIASMRIEYLYSKYLHDKNIRFREVCCALLINGKFDFVVYFGMILGLGAVCIFTLFYAGFYFPYNLFSNFSFKKLFSYAIVTSIHNITITNIAVQMSIVAFIWLPYVILRALLFESLS
jgi:hypothetical protein